MANPPQPPGPGSSPRRPESAAPDPDLLAAVVLHTLVNHSAGVDAAEDRRRDDSPGGGDRTGDERAGGRRRHERAGAHSRHERAGGRGGPGMSLADIAVACERDPADPAERREIEAALEILLADELASRHGARWRATRPAIRAAELSF